MHTHTNKILALAGIASLTLSQGMVSAASTIGTGTVTGSPALTAPVTWDDAFPGTATGVITGITVTAKILPTLNMVVSTGGLDLGNLSSAAYSTGTLSIEIGTNAVNGASVSARSSSGGLQNLSSATTFINSLTTDGAADSYMFSSAIYAASDSTVTGFAQTAALNVEANNTTTNHVLYTSNKPQGLSTGVTNDDFYFRVAAKPNAQTPAGNYKDIVVLTVTGNF